MVWLPLLPLDVNSFFHDHAWKSRAKERCKYKTLKGKSTQFDILTIITESTYALDKSMSTRVDGREEGQVTGGWILWGSTQHSPVVLLQRDHNISLRSTWGKTPDGNTSGQMRSTGSTPAHPHRRDELGLAPRYVVF